MPEPLPSNSNEMARLIEENLTAKSMSLANMPGGKAKTGNLQWFMSGIKRAGFNGVTRIDFSADELDEQIQNCLQPFRRTKTPLSWWVGPLSKPDNLGRVLQTRGFHHNRDMIGMAALIENLPEFTPPNLAYSFEPVLTEDALSEWMPLFMNTFGVPANDYDLYVKAIGSPSFAADSDWFHYLIRVDGKVVATSSLHLGGDVAGLYNIATHPDYRRNGLGTAVTLLTFQEAQQAGCKMATLQTTYPNALRLYHRMGFEVYCKFGIYQRHWQ